MIIQSEMISDQVTIHDLLPLSFLKMSAYTGSKGKLRYRMEMAEEGEEDQKEVFLLLHTWTTPFAFDKTPAEEMTEDRFAFSEKGIQEIIDFLNKRLAEI